MAPCHPLISEAMKTLFAALMTIVTLVTSLLGPAPVLALSSPPTSLTSTHSNTVIFMTKKIDAQAKKAEGRLQSAAGDLTGNNANKIKGAAKQVQGSAMNTAAGMEKGAKTTGQSISESARGFGQKIAAKNS
jgi:uncharacterized protein YjbJ (UPF0337 family)